jgi:hypothetical protein
LIFFVVVDCFSKRILEKMPPLVVTLLRIKSFS